MAATRRSSPPGRSPRAGARPAHIGCSGWNYRDWRGSFYPAGLRTDRWLEHYATRFDTVEVNNTFYRLVKRETAARWVRQTPAGFVFAVKASRYLTHIRRLLNIREGVARFYEGIEPLIEADRLGPVLWQLPENFPLELQRLRDTLELLPAGRHAFEFRHESWFVPEVYALLREHRAALVLGDHPQRPFQRHERTCDWAYVRFHYGSRGRRGNYSARELAQWAARMRRWRAREELYAYFNNDWEAFAIGNALTLQRLLGA